MIGLVALLACILSAYLGFQLGIFRATAMFGSALLGGLAAFNWGIPLARALAPEAPGAATPIVIVAFLTTTGILFFISYRLAPIPLRMPWVLNDVGGAVVGAALGWLVAGVLLASARFTPDVDIWIRRTRSDDAHAARSTPDGFWFAVLAMSAEGGLHRNPKRSFNVDLELPPRRAM
jgi:hypothetical protein